MMVGCLNTFCRDKPDVWVEIAIQSKWHQHDPQCQCSYCEVGRSTLYTLDFIFSLRVETSSITTETNIFTKVPDNSQLENVASTSFEETADRLEQLMKSMEGLLSDVETLRSQCSHQANELMTAATDLRKQQEELRESYTEFSKEMQEIMDTVDELFDTKSAFDAKEMETQKLTRQL
ncbi:hypothetical protein Q5P01_004900 [Channa striata]|uniref:Uncharacterized protein n=1 Tax=Channa striata TaxID=64152 RepID=A0AA88T0T0_CHASR|nr:hypothetical protein Q5P01_004900 [Channa striata]